MGIKEDIDTLDTKLRQLKIEYEQYFAKLLKREPTGLRDEVEGLILRYTNQPIPTTALRFRFNTLVARYASYKQYWTRVLRGIEEGVYEKGLKTVGIKTGISGPSRQVEEKRLRDIYQLYIEVRKRCNEPVIGYNGFIQTITREVEKVKEEYRCSNVDYRITIKDGKAQIIVIPAKYHTPWG